MDAAHCCPTTSLKGNHCPSSLPRTSFKGNISLILGTQLFRSAQVGLTSLMVITITMVMIALVMIMTVMMMIAIKMTLMMMMMLKSMWAASRQVGPASTGTSSALACQVSPLLYHSNDDDGHVSLLLYRSNDDGDDVLILMSLSYS